MSLQDYRFSVELTPGGEFGDDVGILFRYQDSNNFYRLTLDSRYGYTRLEKKTGGTFYPLATNTRGYTRGAVLNLVVEVNGSNIAVDIDDDPLFAVTDTSLDTGTVALYAATTASFDNVLIDRVDPTPAIILSAPQAHSLDLDGTLPVSALVSNLPPGGWVEFLLDGTVSIVRTIPPFSATFTGVIQGEHTIEAFLYDGSDVLVGSDTNTMVGASGNAFVTIGDSLTNGAKDNFERDNVSQDGRIIGFQGYQAPLNDLLTLSSGIPNHVINEGVGGDTAARAATLRIDSILARHPEADKALILLGTNDAGSSLPVPSGLGCVPGSGCYSGSFKESMQQLLDAINNAAGSSPPQTAIQEVFVGLVPPAFGATNSGPVYSFPLSTSRNNLIREYNQVIMNELTNRQVGPDFFKCFLEETNRFSLFSDNVHLNGLGYRYMASLWHEIVTGNSQPTDPCPEPVFLLANLTPSTTAPYLKQNLIEVGDRYYVDEAFTITSIPAGIGLEDAVWIMTANADAPSTSTPYLSFGVDRNVTVYVAYDFDPADPAAVLPGWLSTFTDTGLPLGVSDPAPRFRLYRKSFSPGSISLNGNLADGGAGAQANYIVIVVPQ